MDQGTHGPTPKGKPCSREMCPFPGQHSAWNWMRKHRLVAWDSGTQSQVPCYIPQGPSGTDLTSKASVLHQLTRLGLGWAARDGTGYHHGASPQNWDLGWNRTGGGPRIEGSLTTWRRSRETSSLCLKVFICQHGAVAVKSAGCGTQARRRCPSQSLASLSPR